MAPLKNAEHTNVILRLCELEGTIDFDEAVLKVSSEFNMLAEDIRWAWNHNPDEL